jgi:hypothetical protein
MKTTADSVHAANADASLWIMGRLIVFDGIVLCFAAATAGKLQGNIFEEARTRHGF